MNDEKLDGVMNESADHVIREDQTWSDTNLDYDFDQCKKKFIRLVCRNCGGKSFEVLSTGDYETSAQCENCGMYYIVHAG